LRQAPQPQPERSEWKSAAELGEDTWLKDR
jgi:hypothetical protein